MRHDKKNDIFKRLEQSNKAKTFPFSQNSPPHAHMDLSFKYLVGGDQNRTTAGRAGTLERLASDLQMPQELLIEQFHSAGITGLTPSDRIDGIAKDALLAYLRASHGMDNATHTLYQQENPHQTQIEIIQEANEELIAALSADPTLMYGLHPRRFEELVARLFERQGFNVTLTPASKDGGFDFFAELQTPMTSLLVMAECKRYSPERKVGIEVVRGLHSVMETNKANKALVITSSFFTAGAIEYQRVLGAKMGLNDYNDLVTWLQAKRNS